MSTLPYIVAIGLIAIVAVLASVALDVKELRRLLSAKLALPAPLAAPLSTLSMAGARTRSPRSRCGPTRKTSGSWCRSAARRVAIAGRCRTGRGDSREKS